MGIEQRLSEEIKRSIQSLYTIDMDVSLQPTKKEFEGDYTFVVFPLVKELKKAPPLLAKEIGERLLKDSSVVASFTIVQGFLNLSVQNHAWIEAFNSSTPKVGSISEKVMVEFSSPNTNKPLHLGHLRNIFLGDALSRILKASGRDVVKTCLVNDRGIHICKSMLAYQMAGEKETPENTGIKGDHFAGKYYVAFDQKYKEEIHQLVAEGLEEEKAKKQAPSILRAQEMLQKWESKDPEVWALWKKMNGWVLEGFQSTYETLGVEFDKTYKESETYLLGKGIVEKGLKDGIFYTKEDGSVWINLEDEGLDHKLVLRADGTSVYITQDLGTTELKYKDFKTEKSIWVVGNEQDYHFQVLFAILKKLGKAYADGCYHLSYGMVDLPSGKMKSREGTVVDADDLISEMIQTAKESTAERGKISDFTAEEARELYRILALGALKFYLLKVEPKKRMLFNPSESIDFQGHTGPFVQYTHARIKSILRKASNFPDKMPEVTLEEVEKNLIYLLGTYLDIVEKAAKEFTPSTIANYCFELAKTFNSFYGSCGILNEENQSIRNARLCLSARVAETLREGMQLLGIDVPERM